MKQFGNSPLSKRTPPLSTKPPISEQFFHDPPLCPNSKNQNPTPNFRGDYVSTGINKSLLQMTKKRKKKRNTIITLAKSKLNTINTLLSSALNDSKISHKEFTNIITEKNKYENMKKNIKDIKEPSSLESTEL